MPLGALCAAWTRGALAFVVRPSQRRGPRPPAAVRGAAEGPGARGGWDESCLPGPLGLGCRTAG